MAVKKFQDQLSVRKRKQKWRMLLLTVGAVFLFFTLMVYGLFFLNLFDYRKIELSGPETDYKNQLRMTVNQWLDSDYLFIKHRRNAFIFPIEKLVALLSEQYPQFSSIYSERSTRHDYRVNYTARQPAGIWCLTKQNRCFYFDKDAVVYAETGPSEGYILIRIDDAREREAKVGALAIAREWLTNIFDAKALLQKSDINVARVIIPADSIDEFIFITPAGWKIYFNNATDITSQTGAMLNFLKEKLTAQQKTKLEYIDLSIPDRIYWK